MDVFMASESFAPYQSSRRERNEKMIPALILGALAAYLSWTSNSGRSALGERVVLAVLAFLFGGLYILYYALFKKCR
jgi:hypothetical protein